MAEDRTMAEDNDSAKETQAEAKKDLDKGQIPADIVELIRLLKVAADSPKGRPQNEAMAALEEALEEALDAAEEAHRRRQLIAASFETPPAVKYGLLPEDLVSLWDAAELVKAERLTPGSEPHLAENISSLLKKTD
ncbi:hypothetical protein NCS52_00076700 [Fusarium sp. LHS14.1]|nr:hypothetical protein NCS52_00076700 [Fusarium sp. LHS14.1]